MRWLHRPTDVETQPLCPLPLSGGSLHPFSLKLNVTRHEMPRRDRAMERGCSRGVDGRQSINIGKSIGNAGAWRRHDVPFAHRHPRPRSQPGKLSIGSKRHQQTLTPSNIWRLSHVIKTSGWPLFPSIIQLRRQAVWGWSALAPAAARCPPLERCPACQQHSAQRRGRC